MVDVCEVPDATIFTSLHMVKLQAPGAADHLAEFPFSKGARFAIPLDLDNAVRGDIKILHSSMTKICEETLVTGLRQVTKGHLYHLLVVLYFYVMCRHRAQSVL